MRYFRDCLGPEIRVKPEAIYPFPWSGRAGFAKGNALKIGMTPNSFASGTFEISGRSTEDNALQVKAVTRSGARLRLAQGIFKICKNADLVN